MNDAALSPALGADDAGLICGWRFACDARQPAQAMAAPSAAEWLAAGSGGDESEGEILPPGRPKAKCDPLGGARRRGQRLHAVRERGGEFLWLHFNLANTQSLRWLRRHAALPDTFYDALREGLTSTRIERADDALVAVLNDVNFEFDFESADIATLWICVNERLVVTARTRPLRSADALRDAVGRGDNPGSAAALLEHLMRTQADVLVKVVRDTTARVDQIEDAILARRYHHPRTHLGRLRRLLVRLQRLLAPEPAALFRLLQQPPAWMAEDDRRGLAAASEEFSLMLRDMQMLQDRIKLLQEEVAAAVNEDNNNSLFVLTVVTVLALPINILAGLFGMNVGGIPLAQHEHGFWIVVSIVLAFTAVAAWLAFRKKQHDD